MSPRPTPTETSTAWRTSPIGEPGRVRDAVVAEREGDGSLEQADVPGPEREDDRDVHEQEHDAGGRERRAEIEGSHHRPDREELERPADELEEDRRGGRQRRAEHGESLPRHRHEPSHRPRVVQGGESLVAMVRGEHRDGEERDADEPEEHEARDRPVGDLRGQQDVDDEEGDRGQVEQPVREDGPDEPRARAFTVLGHVPAQHRDAREFPGPRRQHGVSEQARRRTTRTRVGSADGARVWPGRS